MATPSAIIRKGGVSLTSRTRKPRLEHWLGGDSLGRSQQSPAEVLGLLAPALAQEALGQADSSSTAVSAPSALCLLPGDRPDDPGSLLLAAKALVFCGFPYKRSPSTTVTREAQLGSDTHLTVYFSTTEPGIPIPFGADRALLAWITTLTYDTGFVNFTSLTEFFEAFQLARTGVQYHRFEERLHRLLSLSLTLILRTPSGTARLNMRPIQRAYTPRGGAEARQLLAAETRSQLPLLPLDLQRYGIVLDPAFHGYLRNNPVVLPLRLMRRFHNRPLFWDGASYLLYRCWSAMTPSRITWRRIRRQLASIDQHDRRLASTLNRVAEEIRSEYPDFPAQVEQGSHDLLVGPWRPP
jgi:hypothetical protein